MADAWRDSDGHPFVHTYFYPAEQYDRRLIQQLAEHTRSGWGEIEIHLHHGVVEPDTAENARRQLLEFRDALVSEHGCLSYLDGVGHPKYAFVHGNFALANSADGCFCGVDEEMQILAETGCYADFTLPTATFHPAQIAKTNSLYECTMPLNQRAPHRRGRDLERGTIAGGFSVNRPGATHVARQSVAIADCQHRERCDNPSESAEPFSIAIMEAGGNLSARKAGLAVHQVALPWHGSDAARCSSRRTNA